MRIPSVVKYKRALMAIRPNLDSKCLELLRKHYQSQQDESDQVAVERALGKHDLEVAYMRLGELLCQEFELTPDIKKGGRPFYAQVVVDRPGKNQQWNLRPQLARALELLEWVGHNDAVNAFVLTWNPANWPWDDKEYAREVKATAAGKLFPSGWSCGNSKRIRPGDRLFLMRQGTERGIIGSGFATSESYSDDHWNGSRHGKANYVKFQSDTLVHREQRITVERLLEEDFGVPWNNLYASGVQIPFGSVDKLEQLWTAHLVKLGRSINGNAGILKNGIDAHPLHADDDGIVRVLSEIIQRRGQPGFRERLLRAYNGRCAVTGCDALAALEAAHIRPYSGPSSCMVTNGLILRADIHTLFDLNLIGIEPKSFKIALADSLGTTRFAQLELKGKQLALPNDVRLHPDKKALQERWKKFKQQ